MGRSCFWAACRQGSTAAASEPKNLGDELTPRKHRLVYLKIYTRHPVWDKTMYLFRAHSVLKARMSLLLRRGGLTKLISALRDLAIREFGTWGETLWWNVACSEKGLRVVKSS